MLASSAALACSRASSGVVRTNALSLELRRSIRSRYARVSSVDETSRRRTAAAWSSADANGSMAVNGADSRGLVGRRGKRALELGGILGRNRDQESAAGLGVAKHHLVQLGDATPIDLVAIGVVVAPASARKEIALRQLAHAIEEGDRPELDVGASDQIAHVSDQSVAGDIGG